MKTVLISSGANQNELEYSRMINLELSEHGITVIREKSPKIAPDAQIIIINTASAERISSLKLKNDPDFPVICCVKHISGAVSDGIIILKRPIDIDAFCQFILKIASNSRSGLDKKALTIDEKNQTVLCCGEKIALSEKEYRLLLYLYTQRGETVTREDILKNAWGISRFNSTNIVDVYIRYLRKKLDERFDLRLIITVRNKGYLLK